MNRKTLNLFLGIFCLCAISIFAFSTSPTVGAQTTDRARTTPTPKPSTTPPATAAPASTTTPPVKTTPTVAPTPEPEETLKIETELVNLNVRVVDRNNRPINSLSKTDFKILEDNVPQEIEFFSKSEIPTNYSLVIDNSGSLRSQLEKVIEASKILVATNRPADETSVIRFVSSDKIEIVQDFTPSKTDLNDALDNLFIEGGQTAIIDAVYLAAEKVSDYEKSERATDRKRRALIVVSDGEDRDSYYKEEQLFQLLRESDVQIYVVGFVNELTKEGGFISKSPQEKAKTFLSKMADVTGGKAYFPASVSELPQIASNIASELRTQYSIGYSPSNDKADNSFRNIKVVIADGPNKEKRIAITRSGRSTTPDSKGVPTLQNQIKPKGN
jgi:Ca-activated chloride channel homolog